MHRLRAELRGVQAVAFDLDAGEVFDPSGAVAEALHWNPELLEDGQLQIRQRRILCVPEVTTSIELTGPSCPYQKLDRRGKGPIACDQRRRQAVL